MHLSSQQIWRGRCAHRGSPAGARRRSAPLPSRQAWEERGAHFSKSNRSPNRLACGGSGALQGRDGGGQVTCGDQAVTRQHNYGRKLVRSIHVYALASMTALQHSSISPHHPPACAACVLLPLAPAAAAQLLAGAASISGSQRCYCEVHDAATTLQARSK